MFGMKFVKDWNPVAGAPARASRMQGCRRAALGLTALAAIACMPTKEAPKSAGSGTEVGNVIGMIFTAGGKPASGLEVVLYPSDGDTAGILKSHTDGNGAFAFRSAARTYRLISLDGMGNGVMVDSIEPRGEAVLDLSRRDLAPLGGLSAYVIVRNPQEFKVELNLKGAPFRHSAEPNAGFLWEGIPAGRYWLSVYYAGSRSKELPVIIEAGATTVIPDSIVMDFQYSFGISARDTLILTPDQLPYAIADKIYAKDEDVDTIYWVLNGKSLPLRPSSIRMPICDVTRESLNDSGPNLLELRIVLKDTAIARQWHIILDSTREKPWANMAVRAVFLSTQANPRPDMESPGLARFKILQSAVLAPEASALWDWPALEGSDSVLPGEIEVPVLRHIGYYGGCGLDTQKKPLIDQFPGDTVTFFLVGDSAVKGRAWRIRSDERFEDLAKIGYFARAAWPLASLYEGLERWTSVFELDLAPGGPAFTHIGQVFIESTAQACLPLIRKYRIDSAGGIRELPAVPAGMDPARVLLQYRVGLAGGISPDSLPTASRYVIITDSGKAIAAAGGTSRESALAAADILELQALLAALPSVIPTAWEPNRLGYGSAGSAAAIRYLFSGNRGTLLIMGQAAAAAGKQELFEAVEAWLIAKGLL